MIAKLCTWGSDRAQAIQRMHRALDETAVLGVTTNIALHHRVMSHPQFLEGRYDTGLLNGEIPENTRGNQESTDAAIVAAALARYEADKTRSHQNTGQSAGLSPWLSQGRARQLGG